jgi:periplasmic protein TonB
MSSTADIRHAGEPVRLWWTLVAGLLLWAFILFVFGHLVSSKDAEVAPPPPLDAQLVELPEAKPSAPPSPPQKTRAPVVKPRQVVADAPRVDRTVDKTAPPPTAKDNPVPEQAPAPAPAQTPVSKPAPLASPVSDASSGTEQMGAKAIYQPLPKIPDDLRDEAISAVAIARFQINPDGTVSVELIKATSNPRINQIIVNTLKTWKFFPALQNGKPVSSTQEIKVRVDVS